MNPNEIDTFNNTEIGIIVFDDPDAPTAGWQVLDVVAHVEAPTSRRLLIGNQPVRILRGAYHDILPSSFLPVTLDEIVDEWECSPMREETLLTVRRLVEHVLLVAETFAKTLDGSSGIETMIRSESLSEFFAEFLRSIPEVGSDEALMTFEKGVAPDHYVSVSARRPRLAHLGDALAIVEPYGRDRASQAVGAFVADANNAVSWSAGVVAEALLRAMPGSSRLERLLQEDISLAFADLGYSVDVGTGGRVQAWIQPDAREAFARTMLENGFVPDYGTLDHADLRKVAGDFAWGGSSAALPAVKARLARHRHILWSLDKATLLR